jgi:hypothetical protein
MTDSDNVQFSDKHNNNMPLFCSIVVCWSVRDNDLLFIEHNGFYGMCIGAV